MTARGADDPAARGSGEHPIAPARRRVRRRPSRSPFWRLRPSDRAPYTREGARYFLVWIGLLAIGLYHQSNLILLIAGLAAGPLAASYLVSPASLRRLGVVRRAPSFAFAGGPLVIDYTLENNRRRTSALAIEIEDELTEGDRPGPVVGAAITPKAHFGRVGPLGRERVRWQGTAPGRGIYRFRSFEIVSRAPFGLVERRETRQEPGDVVVYPGVGTLSRRWHVMQRERSETRKGRRHDRSAQQQEYHGLRDYRPGDSPRWIHWRTTARVGLPIVKEFEQHSEQDLAILLDPWLPRSKATAEQREAVEAAIRFAGTLCLETCRRGGPRLLLGWTGAQPDLRQGPASVKLLHEALAQLATLRPSSEGTLAQLIDAMPPSILREATVVVVSTRRVDLVEEAERSRRLSTAASRGLSTRALILEIPRGDLDGLVQFGDPSALLGLGELAPDPIPAGARP